MAAFFLVPKELRIVEGSCGSVYRSLMIGMRLYCGQAPFREMTNIEDNHDNESSSAEKKATASINEEGNRVPIAKSHSADKLLHGWVYEEECLRPPNFLACSKRIQCLSSVGEVDKAHTLLKAMLENKLEVRPHLFSSVIVAYAKAGRLQEALNVCDDMRKFRFRPHQTSYHAMMVGFLKRGQAFEALDIFDRMKKDGWQPDEVTKSIIAFGLCRSGHTQQVQALFRESAGKMSTSVCNALLDSFFKSGDVNAAEELVQQVFAGLCQPNVYTYATIIRGRCRHGNFDEALKLFREVEEAGCKPIFACYGSLISGLCRLGRCQDAYILFNGMVDKGIDAGGFSHELLLTQLVLRGRIDEAMRVSEYLSGKGNFVDETILVSILEGLSNADRLNEAKPFLESVMKKGRWSKSRCLQQALRALERREAICKGSNPDKSPDSMKQLKDG